MPYYIVPIDAPPYKPLGAIDLADGAWDIAQGMANCMCQNPSGCDHIFARGERIFHARGELYAYLCLACVEKLSAKGDPPEYATRATAARHLKPKQRIDFVPTAAQVSAWREREQDRFDKRIYADVPWYVTPSLRHYAHMSVETPGHIAYTKDDEAGVNDKQTRVKPGKYLAEFYAPRHTATEIAGYVAQCAAYATGVYGVASTKADITAIYNVTSGPDSCMRRKRKAEYDWQHLLDDGGLPCHPCATYAGPDLAVAYIGTLGEISQRAVIWPDKKQYTRIYGTGPLQLLLQRDGYSKVDALEGARLLAVPFRDGYVVPYMDGCAYGELDDREQYIIVSPDKGDLALDQINGHTASEEPEEHYYCENCNGECNEDERYCSSCEDDHWVCEGCSEDFLNDDYTRMSSGNLYCPSCVGSLTLTCDADECCNKWIEEDEFTYRERQDRRTEGKTGLCRSCAAHRAADEDTDTPDETEVAAVTPSVEPVRLSGTGWWRSTDRLIGGPSGYWHYDGSRGWYYEPDGSSRRPSQIFSLTGLDRHSGSETVNAPDWYIAPDVSVTPGVSHASL